MSSLNGVIHSSTKKNCAAATYDNTHTHTRANQTFKKPLKDVFVLHLCGMFASDQNGIKKRRKNNIRQRKIKCFLSISSAYHIRTRFL